MLSIFEKPNVLLRLEGFMVFLLGLTIYWWQSFSWPLFWLTILLPDVALLGYLINATFGAKAYNIMHSKLLPAALVIIGIATGNGLTMSLALIWFMHIGIDRMLGYGLKYPTGFKFTHLGTIGPVGGARRSGYLPCGK